MNAAPSPSTTPTPFSQPLGFLLRSYARSPSPQVAGRIADYVDKLLADTNFRVPLEERCTYRRMRTYWRLVERLG